MTFYENLRDNSAGPLIAARGQQGVYRVFGSESYDNSTGKLTPGAPTDTAIFLLDLPLKDREFSEEVTALAEAKLLVSAKELVAASVTPKVSEKIVFGGKTYTILAISPVAPSGVVVIYKMAVKNA